MTKNQDLDSGLLVVFRLFTAILILAVFAVLIEILSGVGLHPERLHLVSKISLVESGLLQI